MQQKSQKEIINSFTAKGNSLSGICNFSAQKLQKGVLWDKMQKLLTFLADALIQKMQEKPFEKVTVNEIADLAGVNRSTWFRNFKTKNDALSFKIVILWNRYRNDHGLSSEKYTLDNARDFFAFTYENRFLLQLAYTAQVQSSIYDGFYQIMMSQYDGSAYECYRGRFYSYALFGLLDEWVKRDFSESPADLSTIFHKIIQS